MEKNAPQETVSTEEDGKFPITLGLMLAAIVLAMITLGLKFMEVI